MNFIEHFIDYFLGILRFPDYNWAISILAVIIFLIPLLTFVFYKRTLISKPPGLRYSLAKLHSAIIVTFLFLTALIFDMFFFDNLRMFNLKFISILLLFALLIWTIICFFGLVKISKSNEFLNVHQGANSHGLYLLNVNNILKWRKIWVFALILPYLIYFFPFTNNLVSIVVDNSPSMNNQIENVRSDISSRVSSKEFKSNTNFILTTIDNESSSEPKMSIVDISNSGIDNLLAQSTFFKTSEEFLFGINNIEIPEEGSSPILECIKHNFLTSIEIEKDKYFRSKKLFIFTDGMDNTLLDPGSNFCMLQFKDNFGNSIGNYFDEIFFISFNYNPVENTIFNFCPQVKRYDGNSNAQVANSISDLMSSFLLDWYYYFVTFFLVCIAILFIQFIKVKV